MNMIATDTINASQGESKDLALSSIVKRDNHNPRKTRSKQQMDALRKSIQAKGVLQSILVRPHPTETGKYELVAGETRFDLACEIGLPTIPANVMIIRDDELTELAMTENAQRFEMSPVDEGRAAKQLLADGHSKEETCLILGWNKQKLDGRIQLTQCSDEVAQALMDNQITIGHTQLLSGLRTEAQKSALNIILKKSLTVDQFRELLDGLALKIASAPFDTADCAACPHNSSTQASLFDEKTSNGQCLNKTCFEKKSADHMDTLKTDLAESYNTVALSHEIAPGTAANVVARGNKGVGDEQISECAKCEHYGAVIDTALGNRAKVTESICFNLPCLKEKVASYQNIIATDTAPAPAQTASTPDTGSANEKPASKPKAKPKAPTTPKAILATHHKVHREAAAAHLKETSDRRSMQIITLLALMQDGNLAPTPKPESWPTSLTGTNRASAAMILDTYTVEELDAMQLDLVCRSLHTSTSGFAGENGADTFGSVAEWYSANQEVGLTKHFVMDADYLKAFTKPVIKQLLEASGFDKHYEDNAKDNETFKALTDGKKGDILKAIDASGFDFSGFVPDDLKLA